MTNNSKDYKVFKSFERDRHRKICNMSLEARRKNIWFVKADILTKIKFYFFNIFRKKSYPIYDSLEVSRL